MPSYAENNDSTDSNFVTFATLLTALATLATVIILIWQTRSSKKVSNADFLLRLHNDFFFNYKKNGEIIRTIDNNEKVLQENGGHFAEADLDDYLGAIELISIFIDKGIITKDTVDSMFGNYIVKTWKNQEIHDYIKYVRDIEGSADYYSGVEELANEFQNT